MLTPANIERKRFTTTRLKEGYDQNEVDEFLDRVGSDYGWYVDKLRVVEDELRLARKSQEAPTVVQGQPSMDSIERMLAVAQQSVEQQESEALGLAARVKADAQAEADRLVADGKQRAEEVVSAAHSERLDQIAALEAREAQLTSAVEGLEARATEAREWVASALETFDKRSAKEGEDVG